MTKVPLGFDVSFLSDEEARKILQVLERNEELRRAEKDRISKIQKTKRDIRWLQGVTGEWFEEIQRKKFCNETDVSQMLRQPLTCRLRSGMIKNDPVELQTSRSNKKNPTPFPSPRSFRSSFASLFSFRKSRKEPLKLPTLGQKGCHGFAGPPVSVRETAAQEEIYSIPLENQPVHSVFVPKPGAMREGSHHIPPWDASLLEDEVFRVLDDLDSKLTQEQSSSSVNTTMPFNYESRTQFSRFSSSGSRPSHIAGRHKNHYNETSNMSIYDILRPGARREGFKTVSPRTRTIYDMYRTKEPRVFKEDYVHKNTFSSSSLCFESRQQRLASPVGGHFTARSAHFLATAQNHTGFIPLSHQQSPKRTPLSSIIWNRPDSLRVGENQEAFLKVPLPMEVDPAEQSTDPRHFLETRSYEFYHSQSAYQSVRVNAPMDSAMDPDPFENSENLPFYHQDNPFSRSFFSNTFGQNRGQRFGQSPFWGQQEDHASRSDSYQHRRPFSSSAQDFEIISYDATRVAAARGHSTSSQHWGADISRTHPPRPWQLDLQTSTLESMEVPQGKGSQPAPHFSTPNVCLMTDARYHIKSYGLECQRDSSPRQVELKKETYLFETSQPSSLRTSFPQFPDDKVNSQRSSFQNLAATFQKVSPDKPVFFPVGSRVSVSNGDFIDSPLPAESQPHIWVTEENNGKGLNDSVSEECGQLNKVDQASIAGETPQPVLPTVISNPFPDAHSPLSQDSADNSGFVFHACASERSPRALPREGVSETHVSHKDKGSELKKEQGLSGNDALGVPSSPPFLQKSRLSPVLHSLDPGWHWEFKGNHEDNPSVTKNNLWRTLDNQNPQSPAKSVILDAKGEPRTTMRSNNCSLSAASHAGSDGLLGPPPDSHQGALAANGSSLRAQGMPSTAVLPKRSPAGNDPSLGEKEKDQSASKKQSNQFAISPLESQANGDHCVPIRNDVTDAAEYRSHRPFGDGTAKGETGSRMSCVEIVSKPESQSTPADDSSKRREMDQGDSKSPDPHTLYCTLPRKSPSFLMGGRKSVSQAMAASFRNGLPPFQVKSDGEGPSGKPTPDKLTPTSPASESGCSTVASDWASTAPTATKKTTGSITGLTSVRKGRLPYLIKRTVSCPTGETYSSAENHRREKCLVSDTYAVAISPRPWERSICVLENDSPVRNKSHCHEEYPQEQAGEDTKVTATETGTVSLLNEDPLPSSSQVSGKEREKSLYKYKTTSMFSVSGDDDHVKCLEVVSIYYTLPRKASKKFCNLLQAYAQNANSPELPKVETGTVPGASQNDKLNSTMREHSGAPSSEGQRTTLANSAPEDSPGLPHIHAKEAVSNLPNRGSSEHRLQEMASVEADVSLPRGESKIRDPFPDNCTKPPLRDSRNRKKKGKKLQRETLIQQENVTGEKLGHCQQRYIKSGPGGPPGLPAHSEDNVEHSYPTKSSNGVAMASTRVKDHELSDSEKQVSAVTLALSKLQFDEEAYSGKPDVEGFPSEPQETPQRSLGGDTTGIRTVKDEMPRSACDPPSQPGRRDEEKTSLGDLGKGQTRSSGKHKVVAMSKASRKVSAKDLSSRRHVATIFNKNGGSSGIGGVAACTEDGHPLSPDSILCAESAGESRRLSNGVGDVEKRETPLQVTVIPNQKPSTPLNDQKSNISCWNEFKNSSESPPRSENSVDVRAAQTLEREPGALAQPAVTSFRTAEFCEQQGRLNSPCPLEPTHSLPAVSTPLTICQQQQGHIPSPEREAEPHLYRSKSLKNINVHGDKLRKSHSPKGRERHFSESMSVDDVLSRLTLGNELSINNRYNRRFKSFSELPSSDESWTLFSDRTVVGPKSATCISRPIDYGIFGKEQQLAFLENVKRSLTQGRLWKPSFLKNPGFLKDDLIHSPNPSESLSSNSPSSQMPGDGVSPTEPLNIYEEDPVDSDGDTDTTTDDEYYLDENDKESEL